MAAPTNETPVLDLLSSMTADSLAASSLDDQTLMLVRIAALAAVDAPPVSYLMNLGAAADAGVDARADPRRAGRDRADRRHRARRIRDGQHRRGARRRDRGRRARRAERELSQLVAGRAERPRWRLFPLVVSWLATGVAFMVAAGILPGV